MTTPRMDYLRTRRAYRLIPFGLLATCLLWAFLHFGAVDHDLYPPPPAFDLPFLRAPPPHSLHPQHPYGYGGPPHPPHFRPPPTPSEHTKWSKRADAVRKAFAHAYAGYLAHAGAGDELKPVSNESVNK